MITLRPAAERGHARYDWLDTQYSFSFADYHDPRHMGFSRLRVINDDRIAPGGGFPLHGHRDMEILTYVLDGALEHRDSIGNHSVIRAGEIQRMSAGTGIRHSEFNASQSQPVHLLQIWIEPDRRGLAPGYAQRPLDPQRLEGRLELIASPPAGQGVVTLSQDVRVYAGRFGPGDRLVHRLTPGRRVWLQLARGALRVNGIGLAAGDGAAVEEESELLIDAGEGAELLLFDLP